MDFYVKVEPNSTNFSIEKGSMLRVELEQPSENGRANTELIRGLEGILGQKPAIVSGHRSRRKKLRVDISEKEYEERLYSFLDD